MIIVPVIDLLAGRAVLARGGQRDRYRPIDSPLCHDGDALSLVARLHDMFASRTLYIADLDAILGQGDHTPLLREIIRRFPTLTLWLDAGFSNPSAVESTCENIRCRPVIGSESWRDPAPAPTDSVLSIDHGTYGMRDPSGIAADPGRHPRDLILMSLGCVGTNAGPDLVLLDYYATTTPGHTRLFVAGGVRDVADLHAVQDAGAAGVLLASALHTGRITAPDLAAFS